MAFTFDDLLIMTYGIRYKNWTLNAIRVDLDTSLIQWTFVADGEFQACRKWVVDHRQPKSDVVRTALMAAIVAEEHETREKFTYMGKKVFNPHLNVDSLKEFVGKLENLDIPDNAAVAER